MMKRYDMIVVGAGPAGLSAAIEAAKKGMHVVVYDENAKPGGQLFKQIHKFFGSKEHKAKIRGFHIGEELLAEAAELGVEVVLNAIVIGIFPEKEVTVKVEDHVIHVKGDTILIATGASENMVTFPGWTLPGVLGAGAADVLLKSASMLPEGPVVLCGNGPLILQTVVHLKHFGIPIAGVALTGSPASLFKAALRMPGALLRPQYLLHGMGMGLRTFFGAPCHPAANDISIRRDGETLTVDFTSFGKRKSLQGTAVLLHEGVVPETRIPRLARCRHAWNPRQRYWHAETDVWGKTNVCGIRVAGDSAGVRGADAAIASGEAVALDICREIGALTLETRDRLAKAALFRLYRCDAMQPFMETFFAPSPSWCAAARS